MWFVTFWCGMLRQARYGYYGSLWCGELQPKVPTLMNRIRNKKVGGSPRISRGLFLFKSVI